MKLSAVLQDPNGCDNNLAKEIQTEIEYVFDLEEKYWRQRARIEWLKAGDKNSKFFHLSTLKRRHQNSILKLKNDEGLWVSETTEIHSTIAGFFQRLFMPNGDCPILEVLSYI